MIILKPGSHALRLVMLLLYTGEFPYYSLDLLGDRRTMMHAVNRMGKAHDVMDQDGQFLYHGRLISVSGKDMLKTIRLNAYFLAKLKSFRPDEYRYYMEALTSITSEDTPPALSGTIGWLKHSLCCFNPGCVPYRKDNLNFR